jgi:hypothetical protein
MTTDHQLIAFAKWCLETLRADIGDDLNGGDAEDKAVDLGILVEVKVTEPCGENCHCEEWGPFPQTCVRYSEAIKKAMA